MGRSTVLPDARVTPRFAGIPTFCRYPLLSQVAPENCPVDWAIYGVPFDSGVTYRPGARFGPRAVRLESQYVKRFSLAHGLDPTQLFSLADAGDAPVSTYSPEQNARTVLDFARALGDPATTRLLAVGGDHSIAYANIAATFERLGRPAGGLALLHFDSHLDTVESVWGESWGHASPFFRAITAGLVNPALMVSLGVKGPLNTPDDLKFAADRGVTIVTADQLRAPAGAGAIEAFAGQLRQRGLPAYISFDIDVVDPAFAPGTGTPSVGGLSSAEALALLRRFAGVPIAGADVVEVLPDRDVAGITALLAAHILYEVICLDARARSG
ncbi:MAG TPA: arginase family protein [Phycisphaerales bacterium]|nr:arginase family protein [Phycisphaerales bacterium]